MLSNGCKAIWRWAIVSALAVILNTVVQAAEVTVLPTTLGLPPGVADTSTQSVFLQAARPGSLKLDLVAVEYVSGPEDTRLDAAAAEVVEFALGAGGATIPLKIKLARSAFSRPGTYKIALRIKGQRFPEAAPQQVPPMPPPVPAPTTVDELIELSLTRAPAQITINLTNNSRVTIERCFPWNKGHGRVSFSVSQDGGPDVGGLKFKASAIVRSSDNELAPGKVDLDPPEMKVAGGSGTGTLVFTDIKRAGDFQTNLTFTSPSLAKPVVVPVTIRVKDSWFLPLVVILAGVFAGALVHFLVRIWRPRQLSAYRLTQLQIRLESLARAIGSETTRSEYDRLRMRLQNLGDGIEIDVTTDQDIQQLETDVTTLQTKLATADATAGETLKQQQQALDKAVRDLTPYGGTAKDELEKIQAELASCSQLYNAGRTEEALNAVNALKYKLASTQTRLAQAAIDSMKADIARLPDATARTQLSNAAQQAATNLNQPSADIGRILGDLRQALDVAMNITRDAEMFSEETAAVQLSVAANPAPEGRRAGSPIQFVIDPRPDKPIKVVRWAIDGSHLSSGTSTTMSQTYPVTGNFTVAAEIEYQDGSVDSVAPLRFTILPSETTARVQSILSNIRRVDLGLLLVAVIVAAITGLLDRYVDKAFGTVADYCWAFLWGFGIDNVVRGFSATFTKLSAKN